LPNPLHLHTAAAAFSPGLFMIDDEGTLSTTDVKAKFINGKPQAIEAKYSMRSQFEWDRFIRFMDRWELGNYILDLTGLILQT
jgi:photosystem II reaction center protein Psb28